MYPNKLTVIVNGKGGVGKDTLCDYFCKYYNGMSISAITPTKRRAKLIGWNGDKTDKDRRYLCDLKKTFDRYEDLSMAYLRKEYDTFEDSTFNVLFVTMRDLDDIDAFVKYIRDCGGRVCTLLIRRASVNREFGNEADDNAEDYAYDYIFDNDNPIEISHNDFITLMKWMTDEAF